MNRLSFGLLRVFVAAALLPFSGFGQMPQGVANRLQQSVNDLHLKILDLQDLQAQGNAVSALFLQNLKQLRFNLIQLWQAANTRDGHLNVATIALYLHTNLQQSAFTDTDAHGNAVPHAAGSADIPASPFTVNSGRSSGIFVPMPGTATMPLPLHASAQPNANITFPGFRGVLDLTNIQNAIAAGLGGNRHYDVEVKRVYHSFSNHLNRHTLQGGEVLVRCCQLNSPEPGAWWVQLRDMPLSIADVRDGTAVLPDWNQNGNLEFFVVPEGCGIEIFEGIVASMQMETGNGPFRREYIQLRPGGHYDYNGLSQDYRSRRNIVTTQYLRGGVSQIYITDNYGDVYGNGHNQSGFAFHNLLGLPSYMSCVAIIETEFDVELP
jgi:hypothetical protein